VILTAGPETHIDPIKAMRAGVRGILHKPVGLPELRELLHELFGTEQRRHRYIADSARSAAEQARPGEVITVFSLKGGVGCTVIAANLAIALQGIIKGKVALLDFSLQSGDIGVLLNVYSTHGVHELMRYTNEMDKSVLDDAMVEHSSGVKVLLAPPTLELVESVDAEGLLSVVRALRKHYDVIVIDTFHSVEEATLELMNISNVLLLVTTPEVPALRNISRLLNLIRSRPELSGKVRTVVNRFPSKGSVSMRDIEDCLGGAPTGTIPSDGRLITQSINEGVSFLQTRSVASDMIMRLAVTLSQPYVERQRRVDTGGKVATMGVPSRSEHRALSLDGGALKI
jgi:pilus assembly protein CpaE